MNLEFELDYWKGDGRKKGSEHQRKYCFAYLNIFEDMLSIPIVSMHRNATCAEVGPGPYGGMATVLFPKRWVFIDPLNNEYKKIWGDRKKSNIYLNTPIEKLDISVFRNEFDSVFCTNALDHTEDRNSAEKNIYQILKDEGMFFLVVHCRTPEQLNTGHQQAFEPADLVRELMNVKFKVITYRVLTDRIIPEQRIMYKTLVGVFKK